MEVTTQSVNHQSSLPSGSGDLFLGTNMKLIKRYSDVKRRLIWLTYGGSPYIQDDINHPHPRERYKALSANENLYTQEINHWINSGLLTEHPR